MRGCGLKADEGLELEMMQVVSLQSEDGQAVQRSKSLAVYPGDVVVTQIEHLCRRTEDQRGGGTGGGDTYSSLCFTCLQAGQQIQTPLLHRRQSVVV